MAFTTDEYAAARPTLWHLTHQDNLPMIRQTRRMLPAAVLAPTCVGAIRRGRHVVLGTPVLRDQDLLHAACLELTDGWNLEDYLHDLASRVFFWSGWPDRPVEPGRNAARRYAASDLVIRVPFAEIAAKHEPHFSRCNSGAPRMQHGLSVVRGPATFRPAAEFRYRPADVVEVTFLGGVELPIATEVARSPAGPWEPL